MSFGEEQVRKMKQHYLRDQIALHSWDGNEFADFLADRREEGNNIDSWDYEELVEMVQEFRKYKQALSGGFTRVPNDRRTHAQQHRQAAAAARPVSPRRPTVQRRPESHASARATVDLQKHPETTRTAVNKDRVPPQRQERQFRVQGAPQRRRNHAVNKRYLQSAPGAGAGVSLLLRGLNRFRRSRARTTRPTS